MIFVTNHFDSIGFILSNNLFLQGFALCFIFFFFFSFVPFSISFPVLLYFWFFLSSPNYGCRIFEFFRNPQNTITLPSSRAIYSKKEFQRKCKKIFFSLIVICVQLSRFHDYSKKEFQRVYNLNYGFNDNHLALIVR